MEKFLHSSALFLKLHLTPVIRQYHSVAVNDRKSRIHNKAQSPQF